MCSIHAHFFNRYFRITGFEIDPANRVADNPDGKPTTQAIEGRRSNAIVRREAADEQLVHIELVQGRFEIPPAIRECLKRRIRVLVRIHSFREDEGAFRHLKASMESSALRPLHAMRRPGAPKFLEVFRDARMPVPGEQDGQAAAFEERDGPIHARDNRIAVRHSERPTRAEVVLNVDDEERRLRSHGPDPAIRGIR